MVTARLIILVGLLLVILGLLWLTFPRALSWFGHLPGDVHLERGNTRVFIPITSMLVASLLLTLLLNGIAWLMALFKR